jgi:hypothetical protein
MSAPDKSAVTIFAEAGLVSEELSAEDREVLNRLTREEALLLVEVARRLYPGMPSLLKVGDLRYGNIRICLPL